MSKKERVWLDPEDDQRLYMGAMRSTWPEGVADTPEHRDRFNFWRESYERALKHIEESGIPGTVAITSDFDVSL